MNADFFIDKARHSLKSARLLFEAEEYDSTCNRAYYAMFNAARSALIALNAEQSAFSKTHNGLISEFGQKVINSGLVAKKWGRILSSESNRRLLADYQGVPIEQEDALQAIEHAKDFLELIDQLVVELGS